MKTKIKVFGKRYIQLILTLPLFLFLMGLTIACEDDLMMGEDRQTPGMNLDASANLKSLLPYANLTQIDFPLTINYKVESVEGSDNSGPSITFTGLATTESGFGVTTIFRNESEGTHDYEEEKRIEVDLMPSGKNIVIPSQPLRGGADNSYIYIQFEDVQGRAVSDEIFIGRIVPGASLKGSMYVINSAITVDEYTVTGGADRLETNMTFVAGISLEGLNARVIFRNNSPMKDTIHVGIQEVSNVAQVIADGMEFKFPKQPVPGSVDGNPWIWTQFTAGNSRAASNEILLGRCDQIRKSLSSHRDHFRNQL